MPGRAAAGIPSPGASSRARRSGCSRARRCRRGADAALMQEDVELHGDAVVIPPASSAAGRRRAGEDMRTGRWRCGRDRLRPQDVGVAAALGRDALEVFRPLEVALFSTGDELREPGAPLRPGETTMPTADPARAAPGLGCRVTDFGILPDRAEAVARP